MSTTTGYAEAQSIPAGTTIERVYFVEPGDYGPSVDGVEHETYEAALASAIARKVAAQARHRAHYSDLSNEDYVPLPERISVDCRWSMKQPRNPNNGISGRDTVASRTTYDTLDEAREHLARIRRYADSARA